MLVNFHDVRCTPGVRPALVFDLDGTIRHSKSGDFVSGPNDIALFDGVEDLIWAQKRLANYVVLGCTNQGGVAYGFKDEKVVLAEIIQTTNLFGWNPFDMIAYCPYHEQGKVHPYDVRSLLRKPSMGMLAVLEYEMYKRKEVIIDWSSSIMVGDRGEDKECALAAGIDFVWANDFFVRD